MAVLAEMYGDMTGSCLAKAISRAVEIRLKQGKGLEELAHTTILNAAWDRGMDTALAVSG